MPPESIAVTVFVLAVFAVFMGTLAWVDRKANS
jgi:hypothetical protein